MSAKVTVAMSADFARLVIRALRQVDPTGLFAGPGLLEFERQVLGELDRQAKSAMPGVTAPARLPQS
jgi:hypothetical protein